MSGDCCVVFIFLMLPKIAYFVFQVQALSLASQAVISSACSDSFPAIFLSLSLFLSFHTTVIVFQ